MATPALPQSLPNMALTQLNYTVTKRTKNPQGEIKNKIDAVDKELAEAASLGKNGEVRRLLSKGLTLLAGNEWSDAIDYKSSLVLRSDHVFVDSSKPYVVRLEQIYSSSLPLGQLLTAHLTLCKPPQAQLGLAGMGLPPMPAEVVKDLGKFDEVGRDLRESPFLMEASLAGVADGPYQVQAEVLDGDRSLGLAALRIVVKQGLDDTMSKIEAGAGHALESVHADAMYPVDRVRNVNLGRIEMGTFDLAKELAGAEQVLADAKSGKDPFTGRTGDFKRHYLLKSAGEIMPYHLYVPANYTPAHAYPLIVALHGLGANEDSMLSGLYGVAKLAELHGYIVAAPLGYRVDGGYGAFRAPGQANRRADLSEQDVLEVLRLVKGQYRIDEGRIYLMGHSMGAYGTWALGAAHPEIWAALGPISGGGNPASVEKMKAIPEIVVHGDADDIVPVMNSRTMVDAMKKLGVEVKYIEVPGGNHINIAGSNMSAIFDFFDAHKKGGASAASGH
ncbi:MAG TPA: PHB depolymerase family esterase [Candidatus Saccharimonadales bacterium]|nr:PHB depolymerase family esterase [Candidatus Saccharimonadales bacterium]